VNTPPAAEPESPRPAEIWTEGDILTWSDTREFTHPDSDQHGHPRVVVVQTAVCHDPASGASKVGLLTHYIACDTVDDPLFSYHTATVTYQAVEVPLPCEVEAARALAEFDPASLRWLDMSDLDTVPPSDADAWVSLHWSDEDDIFTRHNNS
jgi:hypothetical protein